jgi:hypothetical protein
MAAATWFVMIPPGYAGKSDSEKRLVDLRVSYPAGSQAWKDANAGRIVQGAEGNTGNPQVSEQLVKWKGPYATEAEAKAAQAPRQQSKNPLKDAANAAQNQTTIANPLDWLANIGQFFSALSQPNLWLRVSKVLLGGVLVVAGLIKLTGTDKKVYGLAGMAASKLPGV